MPRSYIVVDVSGGYRIGLQRSRRTFSEARTGRPALASTRAGSCRYRLNIESTFTSRKRKIAGVIQSIR
jgi:hypothetical protein